MPQQHSWVDSREAICHHCAAYSFKDNGRWDVFKPQWWLSCNSEGQPASIWPRRLWHLASMRANWSETLDVIDKTLNVNICNVGKKVIRSIICNGNFLYLYFCKGWVACRFFYVTKGTLIFTFAWHLGSTWAWHSISVYISFAKRCL